MPIYSQKNSIRSDRAVISQYRVKIFILSCPAHCKKLNFSKHFQMETKHFSLGPEENSAALRILRIIFGLACIGIAAFWAVFNFRSAESGTTLWISVLFLAGFGSYQIWAGLGKTGRYIEISDKSIILRKNSLLPSKVLGAAQLATIEIHPMSITFRYKNPGRVILRFGTAYTDMIEPVIEALEEFSSLNNVPTEVVDEVI
jgi:hypothetical protein